MQNMRTNLSRKAALAGESSDDDQKDRRNGPKGGNRPQGRRDGGNDRRGSGERKPAPRREYNNHEQTKEAAPKVEEPKVEVQAEPTVEVKSETVSAEEKKSFFSLFKKN